MKYVLILAFIFFCKILFAQTGIVILTEEFSTSAPFYSKIHVAMPNGTSTTTSITPEATNVAQHDVDLNNIVNGILGLGYKIIIQPDSWTGGFMNSSNSMVYHRRMFFGVP